MIMHDCINELKTSAQYTWHYAPPSHHLLAEVTVCGDALTRHTVCKKIFQLDVPCQTWVTWIPWRRQNDIFLRQARCVALTDRAQMLILRSLKKRLKNGDVMGVVRFSHMWHSSYMYTFPSTTSSMALTTLLLRCPPYLNPVPTILPTTFTYPSLSHPHDVPMIHPHYCKHIT